MDCKNGRSWSDIPITYGKHNTIRKRFSRWSRKGRFRDAFKLFAAKVGKRNIAMIDSTIIKAHITAASLKKGKESREIWLGVGYLTTKIHLFANIDKKPLDFTLTGGEACDQKEGIEIIEKNLRCIKKLLADKTYETAQIRKQLKESGKEARIPATSDRKSPAKYDKNLYKKRSNIEIMFSRLEDWHGIATRYCRSAHIFDSFLCISLIKLFFNVQILDRLLHFTNLFEQIIGLIFNVIGTYQNITGIILKDCQCY